jgi:hypothetical protein
VKTPKRRLSAIAADLRKALRREATDIVDIGRLLVEAKEQVAHGDWLPWLQREFSLSERSAQKYMRAHRFVTEYESDSYFNLSQSALYWLSEPRQDFFSPTTVKAILQEAKHRRIDEDEALAIASRLESETEETKTEETETEEADATQRDAAEAETILASAPPDLPPPPPERSPPPPQPENMLLLDEAQTSFEQAIETLKDLAAKPAAKFIDVVAADELATVLDFLNTVATQAQHRAKRRGVNGS